jgi:hypothetical protein
MFVAFFSFSFEKDEIGQGMSLKETFIQDACFKKRRIASLKLIIGEPLVASISNENST